MNTIYPVVCKNCGVKWLYCDGPTIAFQDIQTTCPACGSNWFGNIREEECTKTG